MAATAAAPRGILRKNGTFPGFQSSGSAKRDPYPAFGSSEEELEYGPGIVNKLRSRFLNKSVLEQDKQKSSLRRTASLEDWLEKDANESVFLAPSPTSTEPIIRSNVVKTMRPVSVDSAVKKSGPVRPVRPSQFLNKRSVSTSDLRPTGLRAKQLVPFKEVVIVETQKTPTTPTFAPVVLPPQIPPVPSVPKIRRVSTNTRYGVEVNELPAPETVKHVKKLFEEKLPRDSSPGKGSREASPARSTGVTPPPPPLPSTRLAEQRKVTPPSSVLMGPRGFSKPAPVGPKPVIAAPKFTPGARPFRQTVRSIPTPPRTKEIIIITQQENTDSSQNEVSKLSESKIRAPSPPKNNAEKPKEAVPKEAPAVLPSKISSQEIIKASKARSAYLEAAQASNPTAGEEIKNSPSPTIQDSSKSSVLKPVAQISAQIQENVDKAKSVVNTNIVQNSVESAKTEDNIDDVDDTDFRQTKRIGAKALENIRKEGESVQFNFSKNSVVKPSDKKIGVIRPTVQKQEEKKIEKQVEKIVSGVERVSVGEKKEKSPPLERKSEVPRSSGGVTVQVQRTFVVTNVPESSEPKMGPRKSGKGRPQEPQNTMVFNFFNRTETPAYVEDTKRAPSKQIYSKKDSGITFITPAAAESSDFVEQEEERCSPPPPACNFVFENDNIIINGKSNIKKKPRQKRMNISFNDDAPLLFEYPSEQSLLEEPKSDDIMTITETHSVSISPIADSAGGFSSYTPSKVQFVETFELGVSRTTSLTPTPPPTHDEPEEPLEGVLRPLEDGTSFSSEATSDLLF